MAQEVELKLELDRHAVGELENQAVFRKADAKSQRQVSAYYDTPGRKFRRRGFTLRVRSVDDGFVQTVKAMSPGAGLFSRGEWEVPIDGMEPNLEQLQDTPAGKIDAKKLRKLVLSDVNRTTWRSQDEDGILEFALDVGRLKAGGREAPVSELEIELLKGDAAKVFEAAHSLAEHIPLSLGVLSKAERGFALADDALGKVSKASSIAVRADMNVAQGFAIIGQSCIRHFRLNEVIIRRERNPEALHQARVAMRRLRAAFSVFRPALKDRQFEPLREELRWFTGQLGGARNLDVYLEQKRLPREVRKALKQERKLAYGRVTEALQSKRLRLLMIDLVAWIALGEWRQNEKAKRHLGGYAVRRIDRLWRQVASHGELEPMHGGERHELRIEVKKLRYALEFVESLNTGPGRRKKQFTNAIEALQESLGVLNDLVTARAIATLVGDSRELERLRSTDMHEKCLRQAQIFLDKVREIGPYWSKSLG